MNVIFLFFYLYIIVNSKEQKQKEELIQKNIHINDSTLNIHIDKDNNNNSESLNSIKEKKINKKEETKKKRKMKENKIDKIEQKKQKETEKEKTEESENFKSEKEYFEKQIEIFTLSDFTTLEIPKKGGENIYYKVEKNCTLSFAFYLSDNEKAIDMTFTGPDEIGAPIIFQTFKKKNYLYYEHYALYPGMYNFYLNNYENPDITEISFAIKDDLKIDENIGMQKIDKISDHLDDIDERINKMRLKQNIINKKTEKHNDTVNKHNREIFIYSIIEIGIMVLIIMLQLLYIKNKVDKI